MKTSLEDINLFRASQVCRGFVEVQSPVGSKNFREKKMLRDMTKQLLRGPESRYVTQFKKF